MQRRELAEDGMASEATAQPDERAAETASDESTRNAEPAKDTALDEPIDHESPTPTEPENASASDPAGAPEPQAAAPARPFKPSPRPRAAPAGPPSDPADPAGQAAPAEPAEPHVQATPAEHSTQPGPAEPEHLAAPAPEPASSPGRSHLAEDDHSSDPETVDEPVKDPDAGARKRWARRIAVSVATIALMLFIPAFVMRMYGIPSESMETTLHGCAGCDNDRVLVDRTVYRFRDPRPGEVVVFTAGQDIWSNGEEQDLGESNPLVRGLESLGEIAGIAPPSGPDFVKRVIAVGGQTVSCCDSHNRVLVDGVPVDEPYVYYSLAAGPAKQAPFPKIKVPDGKMWMMGDNRNASLDSRAPGNGPVPVSAVAGKVRMIVYPFSRLGSVDDSNPQAPH
jgi:signal peptidase I